MIEIYTDGSSRGNPGPGGYGVVVLNGKIIDYTHTEEFENITNNQMELRAVIHAIKLTETLYKDVECIIYCDSAYCVNICNDWIYTWAGNNWKNSKKEEVKNIELIKELYDLLIKDFPNYTIEKCHGHIGNIGNELADAAATNNQAKFVKIKQSNDMKFKYETII